MEYAGLKQKLNYIHNNPVKSGFVTEKTQWKYSSARNLSGEEPAIEIETLGFLG
jgi:hypothetical protein